MRNFSLAWSASIVSLRNRTAGRRGRQNNCVWLINRAITCVFCRDLHLTTMFTGPLQRDLFKGRWSLAERCLKQNSCHACHTKFAVFFPLPSRCVSSVTSRYHSIKISGSQQSFLRKRVRYRVVRECNHAQESHKCQLYRSFSDIFAGSPFVEVQKFCYHGNVT